MNEMATLKLRMDSSEVINAGKHLKNLNYQAKESASVGKRLEMMWNGYFSTAAGLEANLVRAIGASNSAMRQQQNMYREANAGMTQLASAQKRVNRSNEEQKGLSISTGDWLPPAIFSVNSIAKGLLGVNPIIRHGVNSAYDGSQLIGNTLGGNYADAGRNAAALVGSIAGSTIAGSFFPPGPKKIIASGIGGYIGNVGGPLIYDAGSYIGPHIKTLVQDDLGPGLEKLTKEYVAPALSEVTTKTISPVAESIAVGVGDVVKKIVSWFTDDESDSQHTDSSEPKVISRETIQNQIGKLTEIKEDLAALGAGVQEIDLTPMIQPLEELREGWESLDSNPLQDMRDETQELAIEIYGLGDAAQTSSQDIVKGNKEAKKSQVDLSKAITLETKEAIDESRDYQFKYYDGLYDESQDYFDFKIDLADQETQIVEDQTGEKTRIVQQAVQEQARIQESGTVSMLKSWSDMTQGWDQIAMNALDGLQQTLYQTFHSAFSGVGDAWDNLWEGMKNIAYQVLASIATKMATGLIANIGLNFIGGVSGGGVGAAASGAGSLMNMASMGSSAYNMFGSGGLSSFGTYGGMGSSLFTYGTEAGIMSPSIGGFAAAPQGAALSGLGYGMAGIGGGITGYYLSHELYGKNTGAQVGGTLGGAGGAMLGAQIGMAGGPVGALIGAIIGGILGGAAGGGIGSMFGGGEPDTEDREADAKRSYDIMKDLNRAANLDEDVDVDKYLEAINAGHRSDNRVDPEAMWALYNNLKSKDKLPWWAGDPDQIAHTRQFKGGTEWGQDDWSRYRLYGKGARDVDDETGDSGMAQWFGGGGEGPWGSDGGWDKVKGALDEMDIETLDRLGESLFNVKDGAAAFGVDLAELMGEFDLSQLESGEWATILKEELSPASLMAAMNDELRAQGMNNLEIAAQKQAAAIDSLLGTFDMGEEDTDAWMEQLFKANAEQEDLSKKMAEYQDIVEQLKGVKAGEEEKTKDLITRGRELREELGLGESAFSKIEEGFEKFVTAMEDIAKRLVDAASGDGEPSHHGGYIYHSGGIVGAMLNAGMITPHGGSPRMHSGGLRPDERMSILQAGEYVIQRSSVNARTLATLKSINATGRLPMEQISQAIRQMGNTPKFHSGGLVAPLPAMSPAPQPKGGDSGRPVTINFSPQISINAEGGADADKIEAAVTKALEKSRVALKRQLEQTGYQVVDAQ